MAIENKIDAPTPLQLEISVFDHGKAGVLDQKDRIGVIYRDIYGQRVGQSQSVPLEEFLLGKEFGELAYQKLQLLKRNGFVGERLASGQFLTAVRWFSKAGDQRQMEVDPNILPLHQAFEGWTLGLGQGLGGTSIGPYFKDFKGNWSLETYFFSGKHKLNLGPSYFSNSDYYAGPNPLACQDSPKPPVSSMPNQGPLSPSLMRFAGLLNFLNSIFEEDKDLPRCDERRPVFSYGP